MRLTTNTQSIANCSQIDRLVSTIVWLYNYELVSFDRVKEYLEDIMLDDADHHDIARLLYFEYLRKITETALLLAEKINVPETAKDICFECL